jgi:putative sterol carrier protein
VPDKFVFLSDPWFDAAEKLIQEHKPEVPPTNLVMNLEVANGADTVKFFMGAKGGEVLFGRGATDGADLTLSTDIDTARSVFISGDQQAGMQAFMAGKVKVQGDMTKLMAMQATPPDARAQEFSKKILEITE